MSICLFFSRKPLARSPGATDPRLCLIKTLTSVRRIGLSSQSLPSMLNEDESGFVPGRDIRHALRFFQDLSDHCRQTSLRAPAGAICLDFVKAFDVSIGTP
ncbi:uncharacterized protein PHALS_12419 [Plasmopara halstedii]|uniref:Uncharacterized protein n=1 Tax=Plasmopara halstedii TaxID=4781 RepID=A0A0P1AL36_PLAHL|nr:uncharacterized protein PHALS_12419 [Plasmopara halstedii]CEG42116.1 hypothetical protein PHALS_12419 [Plasmopara halstedii]|eukprot:XP_024578485.1 hypothetical protein PHALS_12419 [Plasmopara halstedii]